ncbi:hypothetical protein [Vibrio aestuarianus]|uniref:hypothetical protein n=1 Tax=Vibrio aestuarianus TaxID=28171 RepID=UPI00237C72A4|nr:hypothetical protein [Vibrio aestuarianus]MDE1265459.1 hypothetical protein [Vibrio aestuarianus]MDE1297590.1 hypothetical protein [Vibrio aestuarianus]
MNIDEIKETIAQDLLDEIIIVEYGAAPQWTIRNNDVHIFTDCSGQLIELLELNLAIKIAVVLTKNVSCKISRVKSEQCPTQSFSRNTMADLSQLIDRRP